MMMNRMADERRHTIRANDPLTRSLLEVIAEAPLTDLEITARAGVDRNLLSRLRSGRASTTIASFVALAGAVGLNVVIEGRAV